MLSSFIDGSFRRFIGEMTLIIVINKTQKRKRLEQPRQA
jgi:hypothetical protein